MYRISKKSVGLIKKLILLLCALFIFCFVVSLGIFHKHLSRPTYSSIKMDYIKRGQNFFESVSAEQVLFNAQDGVQLSGTLIPNKHAKRVVMICHGFQASKEMMSDCVQALYDNETIFFLFDFRAHGQSAGSYVSLGHHEKKDLHAAIDYLKAHNETKNLPLYAIGVSMGAATLLLAAHARQDFKGIVIDSTFADIERQLIRSFKQKTSLPLFPFIHMLRFIFEYVHGGSLSDLSPENIIHTIDVPVLFIHSRNDLITPLYEGESLFNQKQGAKDLWIVESAKHAQIYRVFPEEYRNKVKCFVTSIERCIKE